MSEVEFGIPLVGGAFVFRVFRITDGVAFLKRDEAVVDVAEVEPLETRRFEEGFLEVALGVVLEFPEGSFSLLFGGFIGVFAIGLVAEASDIGGDGGVGVSETVSTVETDLVSGGVVIIGEEAVDLGEPSYRGEFGAVISVDRLGS